MIINQIELNNFRNYGRLELNVGPSVNIVYGNNAQGKTNLIEAINVCSCLSSHRTSKDKDLIKFGEKNYSIKLSLKDEVYGSDTELQVDYYAENSEFTKSSTPKRILTQDGIQIAKTSQYLGICNTVIFAPEDLNLVKGSPSVRRKFLNILISKVSPSYFNLLSKYNRLIEQKNTSLKQFRNGSGKSSSTDMLDFWDFSIAEISSEIILYRLFYTSILSVYAQKHHSEISNNKEILGVTYCSISGVIELLTRLLSENNIVPDIKLLSSRTPVMSQILSSLSDFILGKLKAVRQYDIEKGVSSIGIHRDDLDITLNSISMKNFSSQGQHRSASLSLKLSELDIIKENHSSAPILLLDDVFSELDVNRRRSLVSGITNAQIFITCTDKTYINDEINSLSKEISDISFIKIDSGKVVLTE